MDAGGRADAWGWGRGAEKGAVAMIAGAGYAHRTLYSSLDTFHPLERGFPPCGGVVFPALGASGLVARHQLAPSFVAVSPLLRLFYPYRIALILAHNRV